jgi:Transglutaminase-like superfamily
MRVRTVVQVLIVIALAGSVAVAQQTSRSANDEQLYVLARTDLKAFAQQVSKDATSELGRAQAIVRWLAGQFEWKATDYQKRSVQEIIERRGGNCNELAMVALAAMKELNIKLRRVHEVNIYTTDPERGERAQEMVKEKGNTYSVFGRHHNDHVWLELYDSIADEWFPADPSSGLVGNREWMKARVGFGKRHTLNPITEDMIVPFAIFAADADGKFTINRTQHYLVEEFDRLYDGRLVAHPAWKQWVNMLDLLDDKVAGAFAGNINLHQYEAEIDALATTYERLRTSFQEKPDNAIFVFQPDEVWLNLHHFLYVLGRAENKTADSSREAVAAAPADQAQGLAKLTASEQLIWREAVASYAAGLSKKDLVFDESLPDITNALAQAGDAQSLKGTRVDPSVISILERAAPSYRKVWWPNHRDANLKWQKAIQLLVDESGGRVLAFITGAYKLKWPPAGFPVHIAAYSNWAGAYSTSGNLLVISSLDVGTQGTFGLETIFHEGMHQWDDQVFRALREQARQINRLVPRGLSHALIFFTAGEAVRRVVPGYTPYAEKFGVWQRGMGPFKTILEEVWKPYLDGHGTHDEAFAELIRRTANEPKQP